MYQIDGINEAELNNTRLFTAYKRSGVRNDDLLHYGVGHNDNPPGRGSGRYAYGSGKVIDKKDIRKALKGDRSSFNEKHIIKKGTTFYRTTPNKDEKNSNGPIYVTYIKKDRDIYRGAYSEWILETQGLNRKHPLYERKFKNTEDLIAPSRKELDDLILDISKKKNDKSLKLLAGAAKIDATLRMRNIKKILISFYYDPDNPKESMKKAEEAIEKNKGLRIKDYIDTKGSNSLRDYLTDVKGSFGESKESKEIIINELKKRGYNSIVDYAGVGSTKYGIEGVSPMIVFDDKILNDLGTKKLGFLSRSELTFNPIKGLNIDYKGNKWLEKASASSIRKNSKKFKNW